MRGEIEPTTVVVGVCRLRHPGPTDGRTARTGRFAHGERCGRISVVSCPNTALVASGVGDEHPARGIGGPSWFAPFALRADASDRRSRRCRNSVPPTVCPRLSTTDPYCLARHGGIPPRRRFSATRRHESEFKRVTAPSAPRREYQLGSGAPGDRGLSRSPAVGQLDIHRRRALRDVDADIAAALRRIDLGGPLAQVIAVAGPGSGPGRGTRPRRGHHGNHRLAPTTGLSTRQRFSVAAFEHGAWACPASGAPSLRVLR